MNDLVTWLRAHLDEDERAALAAPPGPWRANAEHDELLAVDDEKVADGFALSGPQLRAAVDHMVLHDPPRVLAEVEVKRAILEEHLPTLQIVQWPHDQTGKGEAMCCRRCQNAENDEEHWDPPLGEAGVFPYEPFVTSYELAPCRTLRLIASAYADRPGYREEEWRP